MYIYIYYHRYCTDKMIGAESNGTQFVSPLTGNRCNLYKVFFSFSLSKSFASLEHQEAACESRGFDKGNFSFQNSRPEQNRGL